MEHDGGAKRCNAQFYAEHLTRRYCERTGKPLSALPCFRILSFNLGSTAWGEDAGKAYYVPSTPYERR